MSERQILHIDLNQAEETLFSGIRRAAVFMGYGLNAAESYTSISHLIVPDSVVNIHLIKEDLNDEEKKHVSHEFSKWIRANGLRELMETFSVFLNQLYFTIFSIQRRAGKAELRYRPTQFERLGIREQIFQLSKVISLPEDDIRIIQSLSQARNCHTHRRGRIGEQDIEVDTARFTLRWRAIRVEVVEFDGQVISHEELFGKPLERDGSVFVQFSVQTRNYSLGDDLVIEKAELKEICLCLLLIGQSLFHQVIEMARAEGVLVERLSEQLSAPRPV